jgi:hypothetical protein
VGVVSPTIIYTKSEPQRNATEEPIAAERDRKRAEYIFKATTSESQTKWGDWPAFKSHKHNPSTLAVAVADDEPDLVSLAAILTL